MRTIFLFILCIHSFPLIVQGQKNLVINGNFEENVICPYKTANFFLSHIEPWKGIGSPDYYNTCGRAKAAQKPNTGDGFAGLFVYYGREYIIGYLKCPMKAGQEYYFEMYVSLSEMFEGVVATDDFGVLFSGDVSVFNDKKLWYRTPQISNAKGEFLEDTLNWMKISGYMTSSGGEKYFAIGNFMPDKKQTIKPVIYYQDRVSTFRNLFYKNKYCAYYYVDDIRLVPVDSNKNETAIDCGDADTLRENFALAAIDTLQKFETGKSYILNNIYFDVGTYNLLPESYPVLNNLYNLLDSNPYLQIEISGHTDSTGSEKDNKILSENRAKAVVEYLQSKGILPDRLDYRGYASSIPVESNRTVEGRAKNRRVEMKIVKQ